MVWSVGMPSEEGLPAFLPWIVSSVISRLISLELRNFCKTSPRLDGNSGTQLETKLLGFNNMLLHFAGSGQKLCFLILEDSLKKQIKKSSQS